MMRKTGGNLANLTVKRGFGLLSAARLMRDLAPTKSSWSVHETNTSSAVWPSYQEFSRWPARWDADGSSWPNVRPPLTNQDAGDRGGTQRSTDARSGGGGRSTFSFVWRVQAASPGLLRASYGLLPQPRASMATPLSGNVKRPWIMTRSHSAFKTKRAKYHPRPTFATC